ncbi:Cirt family transposase [Candida albicans P76067]|nr:Cirt family transposase [Candida albicans P76067]
MPRQQIKKQEVDEVAMQAAIDDIKSGKISSLRKASRKYGLCVETLRKRLNGVLSKKIAHANRRLFSPLQEDLIAQWILDSEREGTPRTRKDVVEFAGLIAAQDGESPIHVSDNWFSSFKKRHPEIHTVDKKLVSSQTMKSTSRKQAEKFFKNFKQLINENNIHHGNVFRVDFTNYIMGKANSSKSVIPGDDNKVYVQSFEGYDSCTVIEAVSMTGNVSPIGIVFSGADLRTKWINDGCSDWYYTASTSGTVSCQIMYSWLNEVFVPYLEQKKSEDEKCLLIMEKDYGTTNTRFQNSCESNGVVPLYLPPCCPHLLPPVDIQTLPRTISPEYKSKLQELDKKFGFAPVKQRFFLSGYFKARQQLNMTPEEIVDRWAFTGMYPNNIRKVVSLSQDVVAKLKNGAEKTRKGERRRADANKSEENETLSTNDSDDDEVISAEMTKSEIIERSQRNLERRKKQIDRLLVQVAELEFEKNRLRSEVLLQQQLQQGNLTEAEVAKYLEDEDFLEKYALGELFVEKRNNLQDNNENHHQQQQQSEGVLSDVTNITRKRKHSKIDDS